MVNGIIAVHDRGDGTRDGRRDGPGSSLPVGGRRNAGPARLADVFARRWPRRGVIHGHLIGRDDFIALFGTVNGAAGLHGVITFEPAGHAGILGP